MLQFHYNLLDKYVDRSKYQLAQMDTDSLYLGLSRTSLEEAVTPALRTEFYKEYHKWFPALACDDHATEFVAAKSAGDVWFPQRACCAARQLYDRRTPGLFKLEFKGNSIVALCSKTYVCTTPAGKQKVSCKGLMKNKNHLTKEQYLKVIENKKADGGINRGFRTDGKSVFTYSQERQSLSFLYIKRQVCEDGVNTRPILI